MSTDMWLAVDPGKMTGICLFHTGAAGVPELITSKEVTMDEFAEAVRSTLKHYPGVEIVCERFIINAATAKKSQAPFSLEMIGVLKQCLRDVGRSADEIVWQSPSDAMSLFPNTALKKLGYWHKGGAGHALDSIRHGLLRAVRRGWKPVGLLD